MSVSLLTVCRAASTSPGPGIRPRPRPRPTQAEVAKRVKELRELVQEIISVSMSTGPRGAMRAVQAAEAVFGVGRDYLLNWQRNSVQEEPQIVLRKLFERLGATYIKLGQFIASSPTLFPEEYVLEFQKCLDRTDPVAWETIRRTLEADLQMPVDDVFLSIDPVPLACASVAQVHSAVLRGSNKEVVIKVLKPGVEDILTADLSAIYIFSKILEFIQPELARTSISAIVGDIRASMLEEVDFVKEAAHIQQFSSYLDKSGLRRVATCPYVYKQFSSRRVLTMERLHGVPLTDLQSIRSISNANPETTLIAALNTWFGSVLACETFHADVHAGNLLVLRDGRIGFIDFGIVGKISPITFTAVQALLTSTAVGDFVTMAKALATMGVTDTAVDIQAFARDLEKLFREMEQLDSQVVVTPGGRGQAGAASIALDDAKVNRVLLQLIRVGEVHGIRFPREFGLLLKQLLYFDRYTRILAPQLSVLRDDRINFRDLQSRVGSA
ncbi:hypothetical protein WJX72_000601 [[Myrmecia] bisecta]|uniref:Protein kinase domain-containing protein n=1 Tax=[Myrmecia] bisecta TaxID=41462 RepID=A0AAW1Q5T5_9CHLO